MRPLTATISANGQVVDPRHVLMSIEVVKEFNRVPLARLSYKDGDAAAGTFALSNNGVFNPGVNVTIQLRREGRPDATVFSGIVVRQTAIGGTDASLLTVELKDALHDLCTVRRYRVFHNQTDTQILQTILTEAQVGQIADTTVVHESMVQYGATDWDFILSRAEANGLLVNAQDGKLSAQTPALAGDARELSYGSGLILDMELESVTGTYLQSATATGWDAGQQAALSAEGSVTDTPQSTAAASALPAGSGGAAALESLTALPQDELKAWADARLSRNRLSLLRGRIQVQGDADFQVGMTLKLGGISPLFNGAALVSGVRHRVSPNGWVTDLQFGLPERAATALPDVSLLAASGLLPSISGLQIGIVGPPTPDPTGQFRFSVSVPALPDSGALWARLATFDAGAGRGAWFVPQQGDEVVLGFFNDDPRQPVILGSLYSSGRTPPSGSSPDLRGFASPGGQALAMDDTDNGITLRTASGQTIVLDDDGGITLTGKGDITLLAGEGGTFTVKAKTISIQGDNFTTQ